MRFVLQTVKGSAQPAEQAKQAAPRTAPAAAAPPQQQANKRSITSAKQPAASTTITSKLLTAAAASTATQPTAVRLQPTAPLPVEEEHKAAVDEVRMRFDSEYSRMEADHSEYDEEEQDEYSDEDEAQLGAPSVAINCSYSINPTSVLQRSHHYSQADEDNDRTIDEEEEEEEEEEERQGQEYQEEEKEQDEEEEQQLEEAEDAADEEEAEHDAELHNFVAGDESATHIVHSQTAAVDSDNNNNSDDEQDEPDDDSLQLHAFQPLAFQPHTIHIQPLTQYEEKDEDEDEHDKSEDEVPYHEDEQEDGVSELCTVQIHQHSLITQGAHSQSHWHAIDTPTRTRNDHHYTHSTPTPTQHTQTASFTLNDSAEDIPPPHSNTSTPTKSKQQSQLPLQHEAGEWTEAVHEARVAALQVELKERVEARRRKLRRASYMEEMEEKRLQKELEAKQRALQQLRLLRVKQEAQKKLAALALQKQKEAEERERREKKDKENQQQQPQPKRRSTDNNTKPVQQLQPSHTRTPSSVVMRKRIKQAHYDRLLKTVERGDTFTKYYDSWYCKPKPKFVRVVCLSSSSGGSAGLTVPAVQGQVGEGSSGGGGTMKLTWGSDMFNMDKSLDLSSVVKVQRGSECAVASKLPVQLHSRAFSLTTAEGRTLHLVAPTQAAREVWLSFVLLMMERRRQPLEELNSEVGETKAGSDGTGGGGVGERVRRSIGGRLSVGRLSLGRLSLGGKNIN